MANNIVDVQDLSKEVDIRKAKIDALKNTTNIPYKDGFVRTCDILTARNTAVGTTISTAGRMVFKRVMGKLAFVQIQDIQAKIQISIGRNEINEEDYNFFKSNIDTGDFIGVKGEIYVTGTGEITIRAKEFILLSKAMRPLPEKFHGLTDIETKYRERYLDLISNENSRKILFGRSQIVSFIRNFLQNEGFVEVETPILQGAVCGASAKPFMTHHNALNKECNLRIAPETYLKQVIAGGFDRVFEVAKCFRNEGMDASHLQEFTQIEWYASYWNYEDNIKFYTKLLKALVMKVNGKLELTRNGKTFNLDKEFPRIDYVAKMNETIGTDVLKFETADEFKKYLVDTNQFKMGELQEAKTLGGVIDLVYKRKIRPNIVEPTFLYNYPSCLVPLARRSDSNPKTIEMFQFLIDGEEMCKAYSELVDPEIQRETLEEQARAKANGDDEAMDVDEDFLLAMEHGMPPMSGLGMGIDRLMMMLYDAPSIRDVVLFPIMK